MMKKENLKNVLPIGVNFTTLRSRAKDILRAKHYNYKNENASWLQNKSTQVRWYFSFLTLCIFIHTP